MSYYRDDPPHNPIEILLNKVDIEEAEDLSPEEQSLLEIPTLDAFLAEEDILRECRSENERLISFLSRPDIIRQLVDRTFDVPPSLTQSPQPNGSSSQQNPSSPDGQQNDQPEKPTAIYNPEKRMKFAYVASELLISDSKGISDAIVGDQGVMMRIFAVLEESHPGHLNHIVALQFSKILVFLLKMNNSAVLDHMERKGSNFVTNVLKHMDSLPIAELVVRILDSPDPEPTSNAPSDKRPTDKALELLSRCQLLEGLAARFVQASCSGDQSPVSAIYPQHLHETVQQPTPAPAPELSAGETAQLWRTREETMANVTMTILGLTERMLQFPVLGIRIPDKLSPFTSPSIITRILDAGLYASCGGKSDKNPSTSPDEVSETPDKVQMFSNGSASALVYSLGLAADLLTTEANVLRDDDNDAPGFQREKITSVPGRTGGMGRAPFTGKGIGPSIASTGPESDIENENGDLPQKPTPLPELIDKKVGDTIVGTHQLEAELAIRFARLAEMFEDGGDQTHEEGSSKPLGSLRLKLAEFFVSSMKKGAQETVDQIYDLGVTSKLLELFAKYPWSSMLHSVVSKSIVYSLEDVEVGRPARRAWIKAGLVPWLIDSWSTSVSNEATIKGLRSGYMGHLIRIGTALKGYIDENQDDVSADLPEDSETQAFQLFAREMLAPAHHREATPLCDDTPESDEGEEARDILEVSGINIVEGVPPDGPLKDTMMLKVTAPSPDTVLDDDEEIKTVDVDDLAHFGADEEDETNVQSIDHDIPKEMREELAKVSREESKSSSGRRDDASSTSLYRDVEPVEFSREDTEDHNEDLKGVIDTVDSSSDDEGSYIAFVDDQKDTEEVTQVTEKLGDVKIEEDTTDSSIAGAVTEIEEPGPIGAVGIPALASNVVSISDDDDTNSNSSDEEYEVWEDPDKPASASSNQAEEKAATVENTSEAKAPRNIG